MQPIRTAGATISAEDGRRLLLMVAASAGLPESFYGDVSVGTLATARSLDRPTELKMVNRQTLWADTLKALLWFVVGQAVKAGTIKGSIEDEDDGTPVITLPDTTDELGKVVERDPTVNVDFPPILEHDIEAAINAIAKAATLGGSPMAGVIDDQTVTRLLLTALGEKDIQSIMDELYPPEEEGMEDELVPDTEPLLPEPEPEEAPPVEIPQAEAMMVEAVRELRDAVARGMGAND